VISRYNPDLFNPELFNIFGPFLELPDNMLGELFEMIFLRLSRLFGVTGRPIFLRVISPAASISIPTIPAPVSSALLILSNSSSSAQGLIKGIAFPLTFSIASNPDLWIISGTPSPVQPRIPFDLHPLTIAWIYSCSEIFPPY